MAAMMTKTKIAAELAKRAGCGRRQCRAVLDALVELACEQAARGVGFRFPGLGKLVLVDRAARTSRNPKTGERIEVGPRKLVKFRVAKVAKDAILGKGAGKSAS